MLEEPSPRVTARAPSSSNSSSAPPGHASAKRTPTNSSHYDFNGVPYDKYKPNSATWMYARDARAQQAGLPPNQTAERYPSPFGNGEQLPLTTPGSILKPGDRKAKWLHHPLTPGTSTTWSQRQGRPGAVRSVYTAGNPNEFDVMVHDIQAGTSARGQGNFAIATYRPAV
ncbi:hypothetical protein F5X99DRAFT_421260 [Biscogniauxia marginata]|nr:hypothetical protein F5X99DRAFT_421260 [Biscogniauxia marginata]